MLGWLARHAEKARVAMCSKEVFWDLARSQPERRAYIRVLATVFFEHFTEALPVLTNAIDEPQRFPRAQCVELYEILEALRNRNDHSIRKAKKRLQRVGMCLPDFAEEHAKLCGRAIEIWMIALGIGIHPETRRFAAEAWRLLQFPEWMMREAFGHIRAVERATERAAGVPAGMGFAARDDDAWCQGCGYVPKCVL